MTINPLLISFSVTCSLASPTGVGLHPRFCLQPSPRTVSPQLYQIPSQEQWDTQFRLITRINLQRYGQKVDEPAKKQCGNSKVDTAKKGELLGPERQQVRSSCLGRNCDIGQIKPQVTLKHGSQSNKYPDLICLPPLTYFWEPEGCMSGNTQLSLVQMCYLGQNRKTKGDLGLGKTGR